MPGTNVECPNCGAPVHLPITFDGVTFADNRENVWASCPHCSQRFDAAPTDGIYSTVAGRLRLIVDDLAAMDQRRLKELQQRLLHAERDRSPDDMLAVMYDPDAPPSLRSLIRPTTHEEMWNIILVVLKVIAVLLASGVAAVQGDDFIDLLVAEIIDN